MTDTPGGIATEAQTVRLKFGVIDQELTHRGATTETSRAQMLGLSRITLWRYRQGTMTPGLDVAARIAEAVDATLDEIVEIGANNTPPGTPPPSEPPSQPSGPSGPPRRLKAG